MAKFDPYEWHNITLKVMSKSGEVFDTIEGRITKMIGQTFKNGYSNWDGKVNYTYYELQYTRPDGSVAIIKDEKRKGVISEAILRHADVIGACRSCDRFDILNLKGK
jgi:hypothetical protein